LEVNSTTAKLILQENDELRQQLKYSRTVNFTTVGGDVIVRNEQGSNGSLIINKGATDGISAGDPVIVDNGLLVGKISHVELRSAIVQLLTDNKSKIAATVMNNQKSIGVVEGGYEISVQMNLIPQHELVSIGDMIITSGLETQIPRGLLIGRVEAIKKEIYQPFQQAVLTPLAPLESLTTVLVITHTTNEPARAIIQ
jgi:rod shape-determining protein MreC